MSAAGQLIIRLEAWLKEQPEVENVERTTPTLMVALLPDWDLIVELKRKDED